MKIFICSKCFNAGGTMINRGTHREPWYMHAPGTCSPMDWQRRNEIYGRTYPGYWGFLTCLGVDFPRAEQ